MKLQKDTWTLGASHMALLHNALIRGYNSIYIQAPHVKPQDHADFIAYALTWYKFIKAHHDAEEESLFPQCLEILGKRGDEGDREVWGKAHEEHERMMPPLQRFASYLTGLLRPEDLDSEFLVALPDDVRPSLETHLHSEIAVIASLSKFGSFPAAEPALEDWGRKSVTGAGVLDVLPFMLLNHEREYESGMWRDWPPIPGPLRWVLLRGVGWWKGKQWRFASCEAGGERRALFALGDGKDAD